MKDKNIFTIGDNIITKDTKDKFEINSFEISGETIIVKGKSGISSPLHLIEHVNTPLFTTLDGKDIYEGDEYYYVNPIFRDYTEVIPRELIRLNISKHIAKWKGVLYTSPSFSTQEIAEKYVDENKPQFSKKQVINILKGFDKEINEFMYEEGEMQYSEYIEKYKDEE